MKLGGLLKAMTTGQIRYVPSHHFYRWLRSRDIEATPPVPTAPPGDRDALEVHMLTGRRQYVDLIYAAKSFLRFYQSPISLFVHGDASLANEDVRRIERHLPGVIILLKGERDAIIEPELRRRGLDNCILFRRLNPFAAKLIDAPLVSSAERICLLDTDCLAFRSLDGLSREIERGQAKWIFARDPQAYPYCLSPEQARGHFGITIEQHLNSGFCVVPRELDLEQIDRWLAPDRYPLRSHFAEQTILAALASRGGVTFLPDAEFNTGRTKTEAECSLIHYCGHYLSQTRIAMRREGQPMLIRSLKRQAV